MCDPPIFYSNKPCFLRYVLAEELASEIIDKIVASLTSFIFLDFFFVSYPPRLYKCETDAYKD